jgi:hypothetical protein
METEPIYWETHGFRRPFPCFTRGCPNEAVTLARFRQGSIVVQACLCDACLAQPSDSILRGLGAEPEKGRQLAPPPFPWGAEASLLLQVFPTKHQGRMDKAKALKIPNPILA